MLSRGCDSIILGARVNPRPRDGTAARPVAYLYPGTTTHDLLTGNILV